MLTLAPSMCGPVLEEELTQSMRLLGVMSVRDLKPEHVRYMDRAPAPLE